MKLPRLNKIWVDYSPDVPEHEDIDAFYARNAKENKPLKAEQIEEIFRSIRRGEDFNIPEDTDEKLTKAIEEAYNSLAAQWKFHNDTVQEKEAAEEEFKKKGEKEAQKLFIAVAKSHEVGLAMRSQFVKSIQTSMGKKFEVTDTGLNIAEGVTLTIPELGEAIANLAKGGENLDSYRAVVMWNLGDLLNHAVASLGEKEANTIMEQVCEMHGRQKHTIVEAMRIARLFPRKDRHPELTYTHHQEIANFRKDPAFTGPGGPARLKGLVQKALKGGMQRTVDTATGKVIDQSAPMSCAAMRDLFREAAGRPEKKDKPAKNGSGDSPAPAPDDTPADENISRTDEEYFYVSDGNVMFGRGLDLEACKEMIVISITGLCVMQEDGSEGPPLKEHKIKPVKKPAKKKAGSEADSYPD